jgi:hypothetical protein
MFAVTPSGRETCNLMKKLRQRKTSPNKMRSLFDFLISLPGVVFFAKLQNRNLLKR